MPVVNTTQARVELSAKQVTAFIDLVHAHFSEPEQIVMISIEETNLPGTIAVEGKGLPMTLITHWGKAIPFVEGAVHYQYPESKKQLPEDF